MNRYDGIVEDERAGTDGRQGHGTGVGENGVNPVGPFAARSHGAVA